MKRLIKKAEAYNGFNYSNDYFEIYKNPNSREIDEVKKQSKYNAVRGVILSDWTIFIWPGEISHNNIVHEDDEDSEIKLDNFRFAYEPGAQWICDCPGITFDEAVNYIIESEPILEDIGDLNTGFYIMAEDKTEEYFLSQKISASLIKKSELYDGFNYNGMNKYYFEVYKEPTSREIDIVMETDPYNSIRGVIDKNNIMYIWPAVIDHFSINKYVNVPVNNLRFSYETNEWLFHVTGSIGNLTLNETAKVIQENKSKLQQIGSLDVTFYIIAKDHSADGKSLEEWLADYFAKKLVTSKLRKKSEIYDGFNYDTDYDEEYFEVYKNPSFREIDDVIDIDPNDAIRGVIDESNNIYIWPAEVDHFHINDYVSVPVNYFRFRYDENDGTTWLFDLTGLGGSLSLDDAANIINNNKDKLEQIGSLNNTFSIIPKTGFAHSDSLEEWLTEYFTSKMVTSRLIKKSNYTTLVIVDIQKNFSLFFDEKYLDKVENIINKGWNNIIVVVDNIDGTPEIPEFIANAANEILYKQYGGWEQLIIDEYIENGEIEIVEDDEVYKIGKEYIVRGNVHEYFQIPEDMEVIFKDLQEATIIGGGDEECLDDIENALKYFGVNVKRNSAGIYGAWGKNDNNNWAEDISWMEV